MATRYHRRAVKHAGRAKAIIPYRPKRVPIEGEEDSGVVDDEHMLVCDRGGRLDRGRRVESLDQVSRPAQAVELPVARTEVQLVILDCDSAQDSLREIIGPIDLHRLEIQAAHRAPLTRPAVSAVAHADIQL